MNISKSFQMMLSVILLLAYALPVFSQETFMDFIGTTSTNKTFYVSKAGIAVNQLEAHWECHKMSTGVYRLAAIESHEETRLLADYFETIYGPGPVGSNEVFWTAGTLLGGDIPLKPDFRWSTTGKLYEDWGYMNWCCRTEPSIQPYAVISGTACIAAEYRTNMGANPDPLMTVSWLMKNCFDAQRFLCMSMANV